MPYCFAGKFEGFLIKRCKSAKLGLQNPPQIGPKAIHSLFDLAAENSSLVPTILPRHK